MTEPGHLDPGEYHPAARSAFAWLQSQGVPALFAWQEAFSSCALEGNLLAELCAETLRRVLAGESVSDRYLLALCWTMAHDHTYAAPEEARP